MLVGKPDAADGSWSAESNTRPAREKQGGLIVPIDLPTKTSPAPSAMAEFWFE